MRKTVVRNWFRELVGSDGNTYSLPVMSTGFEIRGAFGWFVRYGIRELMILERNASAWMSLCKSSRDL